MNNSKKLKEGDIFYVKVNEKYIFGRLLIDTKKRIFKLEPQHKLKFYNGCYLVEVYKGIYDKPELPTREIIYPSSFVFSSTFYPSKLYKKTVEWTFYKNEPIDYKEIDFPEVLEIGENGYLNLRKFDISLATKTLIKDFWPKITEQKYTGCAFSIFYQLVDESFLLQNRKDLIMDKERTYFTFNNDLRFQIKDRENFYKQIGEDINISYYKLAMKHGYDIGRFYIKK